MTDVAAPSWNTADTVSMMEECNPGPYVGPCRSGCFKRVMPPYDEAPPNDVPDRIDCVSEAWLVSEVNVMDGVGLGAVVLAGSEGDGKGFSEDRSWVGRAGM